ncbi:3-dehydroquinate synthase [bacterium]|nr:3-dehydroquinate synthase [bacterium]
MPELPRRILLSGFMGSGKSSVGRELAGLLGYRFADTDAMIVERTGMEIPRIWELHGEGRFRELELECCRELADAQYVVIASGGGTVLDPQRRELLARGSHVVNLTADLECLLNRIESEGGRPLMFTDDIEERIEGLLAEREPVYRIADQRVDTSYLDPLFAARQIAWHFGEPRLVEPGDGSLSAVHVLPGLLRDPVRLDALLPPQETVFLLTDELVMELHGDALAEALAIADREVRWLSLPRGESSKSLEHLQIVLSFLAENRANRDSLLLGLGGGVVTDIAGLAASLYMRGISCVMLPTSLMGMVDAAIGGKTAINFGNAKNLVGSFHLPLCVACDPTVLATLAQRELRCGLAEVVKYDMLSAAIDEDQSAAYSAASRGDIAALTQLVERCSLQKCSVVSSDFREQGERKLLNFGHTIGHALEALSEGLLTHGEAVGLGMLCACRIAEGNGMAQADNEAIVRRALEQCRLPVEHELPEPAAILSLVKLDKKNRSGQIEMVLPVRPGELMHGIPVERDELIESLEAIRR